ncbi:lanthionine synthetase C family protein [Kitasatospora sp. NPDC059646]|uniref:lanthionine synthetase C family protein n=1 Tax=Kitasatospora sp. NPDC059646 TaxID=3346893 RepID=UPI003676ACDF
MHDVTPRDAGPWVRRLGPGIEARALAAARLIAERAADPARVEEAVGLAARQTRFPEAVHWDPVSLAQGSTGQALLCAQLHSCFPGEGWDRAGHAHLSRSVAAVERRGGAPSGVFAGLSGVALTAELLGGGRHYRSLRTVLDGHIAVACLAQAAALSARDAPSRAGGVPVSAFDLISGLSGIATYLLPPGTDRPPHPALPHVLRALVGLALAEGPPPAWYTPAALLHDEDQARTYPLGNLNCGLAHGIPGPLALMALASRQGVEVEGLTAAIRVLARWLVAHRENDAAGPNWPAVVPLVDGGHGPTEGRADRPTRTAWCYGSPGIARALWLAGRALREEDLCCTAVEAMEAVYRRPVRERLIDSPTLCHGVAGLLQVTLRFACDTGLPVFTAAAAELTEQILAQVDPRRPMGIAAVEPGGNLVDQPGFLDGAGGVALVLLAAATAREPTWDRALALS